MKELLLTNYSIHVNEHVRVCGREGFRDHDYLYFIISSANKETIHLEQAALSYYLAENGFKHTALPIPTVDNSWFVDHGNNRYIVLRVEELQDSSRESHGTLLANFHETTAAYTYEPKEISSYGLWKDLWIKKLTAFENKLNHESTANSSNYYRRLVDVFPYIIGISENAIQYMQESETDKRYHYGDQGVFCFRRYKNHVNESVIWTDDLVYDHPTRDLAEYIRWKLLEEDEYAMKEVVSFMTDYQAVRPLSIFSWRLLYARLIYPIHIFDLMEDCFKGGSDDHNTAELNRLIKKQVVYEKRLANLYDLMHVPYKSYDVPVLEWLSK
ncbi:hypothetical protein [Ornithinibacillus xuwenensis]|uniref:Spore coat protein YutH n=1 Tax=Ornithinibacillus xuwenensis TaxID=3144668 RepID=A0ABU9XK31_9BACI